MTLKNYSTVTRSVTAVRRRDSSAAETITTHSWLISDSDIQEMYLVKGHITQV